MSLQYIKDDRGKDQLLYKGYLYKKVRASGNKTFWKCAEYHKYCCTGRAHTSHGQVIKSLPHLHPPTRMPTEAAQGPCGMEKSTTAPESTPKTNAASCNALSEEVHPKKWCTNHPSQTIQRLRACLRATRQPSPNLQEPMAAVETTVNEPVIPSASTSPGFEEFTGRPTDTTSTPNPALCKEKHTLNSLSVQADREAGRQRFRLSTLLPGETLQEMLSRLSTAALQWLCPQEHSKDQVVDMVILEQFLNVLPVDMQTWLKAQEPGSSGEAVQLAMAYRKQEPAKPIQDMITFEDVSIHFTEEEWTLLDHKEKNLYWNVMHQNYDNIACLASDQIKGKSQKEDPLQEGFETAVEWLEKSKETILQHPEQKWNKNRPENQQKRTLEKEEIFIGSERNVVGPDRDIILLDTEVGLHSQYIHVDYGEGDASAKPINGQKSLKEEDLTGSYGISSKIYPQNFKQNVIREEQNDPERQQSEKENSYGGHWRDPIHHETGTSHNAVCTIIDDTEQTEPLMLNSQTDFRYRDKSLETIMERISPGPDSDPMLIYSKICSAELNESTDLTSENQSILESGLVNSPGNEGGLEKLSSFGSVFQEPATHFLHSDVQQDSEAQFRYNGHSNVDDTSKISCGDQLITCPKYKHFNSFKRYACSNPEAIISSLSALIKRRRVERKYFSRRNLKFQSGTHHRTHTRSHLQKRSIRHNRWYFKQNRSWLLESGATLKQFPKFDPVTLNTQIGEAFYLAVQILRRFSTTGFFSSSSPQVEQQEISFPLPFLDNMATEPTLSQVMTVLQQMAANIAEIKVAISNLHSTVTSLQNGYFSDCTVEAEGGISDLKAPSQKDQSSAWAVF